MARPTNEPTDPRLPRDFPRCALFLLLERVGGEIIVSEAELARAQRALSTGRIPAASTPPDSIGLVRIHLLEGGPR